jgi:GNAT superfamily N-acetyltransferase
MDAEATTALAHEAKASWGYPKAWIDAWAAQLTVSADYIDQHRVAVAFTPSDIVCVCAIEDHGDHLMLEYVWVSSLVHRRGVGRYLVLDAVRAAHRAHTIPVRLIADPFALDFCIGLDARVTDGTRLRWTENAGGSCHGWTFDSGRRARRGVAMTGSCSRSPDAVLLACHPPEQSVMHGDLEHKPCAIQCWVAADAVFSTPILR